MGVAKRIPREGGQIADIKHASVSGGINKQQCLKNTVVHTV